MSNKARNEQHDEAAAQDLCNLLGLTRPAAEIEVAAAHPELVAELVETSNKFRADLANWREKLAEFRRLVAEQARADREALAAPVATSAQVAAASVTPRDAQPSIADHPEPKPANDEAPVATIEAAEPEAKE